jgi:hypothetical protein
MAGEAETEVGFETAFARLSATVRPVINGGGANTMHSGSRMRPEALAAIEGSHGQFYNLNELLDAAGGMLVGLLQPWALRVIKCRPQSKRAQRYIRL